MKLRHLLLGRKADKPRQHIKNQRHYFANKGLSSQSYGFSSSHVWMWELDHKEGWTLKNRCFLTVVLEKTLESTLDCKKIILIIHQKDWCWSWSSNTLATWCEEMTHLKRPWCWERLRAGGEGGDRGWDGWMAKPTRWTWVWARSGSWWWTGKPGVLRSMGSQRAGHDWATELNWTELIYVCVDRHTWGLFCGCLCIWTCTESHVCVFLCAFADADVICVSRSQTFTNLVDMLGECHYLLKTEEWNILKKGFKKKTPKYISRLPKFYVQWKKYQIFTFFCHYKDCQFHPGTGLQYSV